MGGKAAFVWYLHGPNLLILALMGLLFLRLVLSWVPGVTAVVQPLAAITGPVTSTVGFVTPRIVPPRGVIALSIAWLLVARAALYMAALAKGVQL